MCDGVTAPCVSFLAPGWFLFLLSILSAVDLWTTSLPSAAYDKACKDQLSSYVSQTQEATDCKVSETKMVPLQQPFAAQPQRRGLFCTAVPTESPQSGKEAIWDVGVDTHYCYQP